MYNTVTLCFCGCVGGAKLGHFMASKDVLGWFNPFFMGLKAFASKSTVVVLLGRGPVSTSLVTTIIVRLPKKGGIWEEGQIRFVGKPVFLQLDWVEPI